MYPDWYLNPPQDNSKTIHGVGEGYNLENANKTALKNISSKILVTLSSNSQMSQYENNYEFSEETKISIKERTADITFNNHKTLQTQYLNSQERFIVLVAVDKPELIKQQTQDLNKLNDSINQFNRNSKKKSDLERISALINIQNIIPKAETKINILTALSSKDYSKYLNKYKAYKKEYNKLLSKTVFSIQTKSEFDKDVGEVFKNALNKQNFKIGSLDKSNVILSIKSKITSKEVYGSYFAKIQINVNLLNKQKKIIKSNKIEIKGSSSINKNEANKNALRDLEEQIEENGINGVLKLE